MDNQRNCTIDFLRLFFSILVVAIHTSPLIEFNEVISYFCSQTISRLAVPFFSAVAGYFFFSKSTRKYWNSILKYLIIYSFWSVLMFIYDAIRWKAPILSFVVYVLRTFFLTGWHHYWYLLAILYTMVLIAVAKAISPKANRIIYYLSFVFLAIGIAINNYGSVFGNLPVLSFFKNADPYVYAGWLTLVLPFFMLGYRLSIKKDELHIRRPLMITIGCTLGLLIEIFITTVFDLHSNVSLCLFTYPTVFFLIYWALKNPYSSLYTKARYCAGMASVIYLGHMVIALFTQAKGCSETLTFLVSILITAIVGLILTKIDKPIIRKII